MYIGIIYNIRFTEFINFFKYFNHENFLTMTYHVDQYITLPIFLRFNYYYF